MEYGGLNAVWVKLLDEGESLSRLESLFRHGTIRHGCGMGDPVLDGAVRGG